MEVNKDKKYYTLTLAPDNISEIVISDFMSEDLDTGTREHIVKKMPIYAERKGPMIMEDMVTGLTIRKVGFEDHKGGLRYIDAEEASANDIADALKKMNPKSMSKYRETVLDMEAKANELDSQQEETEHSKDERIR